MNHQKMLLIIGFIFVILSYYGLLAAMIWVDVAFIYITFICIGLAFACFYIGARWQI